MLNKNSSQGGYKLISKTMGAGLESLSCTIKERIVVFCYFNVYERKILDHCCL